MLRKLHSENTLRTGLELPTRDSLQLFQFFLCHLQFHRLLLLLLGRRAQRCTYLLERVQLDPRVCDLLSTLWNNLQSLCKISVQSSAGCPRVSANSAANAGMASLSTSPVSCWAYFRKSSCRMSLGSSVGGTTTCLHGGSPVFLTHPQPERLPGAGPCLG